MTADLGHYHEGRWSPPLTMAQMAQDVATEHGFTVADLRGEGRRYKLSHARQALMHRIYATGRFSLTQIGNFLGGKHHATILFGIRAHERRAG